MDHATRFAATFGLRVPIFQAPVGSAAGPELAAAVSQAGGLGALALTWTSWEDTQRAVAEVQKRTQNPFQVNFVLAFEPKSLRCALEAVFALLRSLGKYPLKKRSLSCDLTAHATAFRSLRLTVRSARWILALTS